MIQRPDISPGNDAVHSYRHASAAAFHEVAACFPQPHLIFICSTLSKGVIQDEADLRSTACSGLYRPRPA